MDVHAEDVKLPRRLVTDRLTLRPADVGDADAIVTALNDWNVTRWLTMVPYPYTRADAEWWIGQIDVPGHWIIDAGYGAIGAISIKPDMGYWLAAAHRGRGYMTEAVRAVVDAYFEHTDVPLVSGHFPDNAASRAILVKLGFRDTHVEQQRQVCTDTDVACQRMVLTRDVRSSVV